MVGRTSELPVVSGAGVVHDLGNLIQIAFSAINIVSRTPDMPAIHSGPVLARAKASLEQAGAIVRQSLSDIRDRVDETNVTECVADVAALVETLDEAAFALKLDIESGMPKIECDPIGFRRALLNLVFNARDAIADTVLIEARTIRQDSIATGVELRVTDDGIGMSPATIARAFDPFFTTKSDGLGGVGLPMVERFVRGAGGDIAIESEPTVGTTVAMRLPAIAPAAGIGVVVEMANRSEGSKSMKLYYAPGACSLSGRISLHEAGLSADYERVDIKTKITEHGYDYIAINPKGYVPMLVLDDGNAVTENTAILEFIADREPRLAPGGPLGRTRLIEMLSWLSTELHVAFKPFFHPASEDEMAAAREAVAKRLELVSEHFNELYLFGPRFTVADAYLFVMLRWAKAFDVRMAPDLLGYFDRVAERDFVRRALAEEGLA